MLACDIVFISDIQHGDLDICILCDVITMTHLVTICHSAKAL